MKQTIYLWVPGMGPVKFEYETVADIAAELSTRSISIGNGASIGYRASIGNGASIGYRASIGNGASIGDGASIGYRASIGNGASIGDGASIGYRASIGDGASIGYRASIGNGASIGDGASIGYRASIGNGASIGYRAIIGNGEKPKTLFITGSRHTVNYWGQDVIAIGCKQNSISDWRTVYESIGREEGYTDEEIAEYKGYIEIVAAFHATQS